MGARIALLIAAVVIALVAGCDCESVPPGYVIEQNGHGRYRWAIYKNGVRDTWGVEEYIHRNSAIRAAQWHYEEGKPWTPEIPQTSEKP